MAQFDRRVTSASSLDQSLLPDAFSEFAIAATYLHELGTLESVSELLRLQRKSGFQGLDLFVFFLALFASRIDGKIRGFADRWAGKRGTRIAALAGRKALASQSSVSRALTSVTDELAQAFASLLLRESTLLGELLHQPAVQHADCLGQRWHVFDMDPTATGIRQRALPEGDDLPEAVRKSEEIAKPGYAGRKRGQGKVCRPTLMHRGARVYLDAHVEAGNSDWADAVQKGLDAVDDIATRCGLPIERCVYVTDGESGGDVQSRLGLASNAHFVTRLAAYEPLDRPEVLEALQKVRWERVDDGCSGPVRWATEFGDKTFRTGAARLVISRFENRTGQRHGAGKLVEHFQYEVYATDLSADAFPAPELVTLYYARGGIENYFAIEDKDFELDHIYSYNPAAQLLVTIIALFLHNLQIVLGVRARGGLPPVSLPEVPREVEAVGDAEWVATEDDEAPGPEIEEPPMALEGDAAALRLDALRRTVDSRTDLSFDGSRVLCLAGHELQFQRESQRNDGTVVVRLRVRASVCRGCQHRASCTSSTNDAYQKELDVRIHHPTVTETFIVEEWCPPRRALPAGPVQMCAPILCPQRLRHEFFDVAEHTRVRVATAAPPPSCANTYDGLYALTAAQRQHRRRTWTERLSWNALPDDHPVTIEFIADARLQRILPDNHTPARCTAHN